MNAGSLPFEPVSVEGRRRLLVVDDDAALLEVTADLFREHGYEVVTAATAGEALQRLSGTIFDALFSDIMMPGMSGLELLRAARQHDLDLPVVLVTGGPTLQGALKALDEGALQYLVKPVPGAELLRSAARAVSLGHLARLKRQALQHLGLASHLLGDHAGLEVAFDRAIAQAWMAYQPIVRAASGILYGYEALLRSDDAVLGGPGPLIDAAERLGRQADLGRAVQVAVLSSARRLVGEGLSLFVNAQARDLEPAWAAPLKNLPARLVLEVTERSALSSIPDLRRRVSGLRAAGVRVAIDDLGAGYAGLTSFAALEPDIVKLDMALVRDLDREPVNRKLVSSLCSVCRELGILTVAEGIETEAERNAARAVGCDLLQGYLIGRPSRLATA